MSRKAVSIVKFCEICGCEYDAYHKDQKYCEGCRQEGRRRRDRSPDFRLPPMTPVDFIRKTISDAPDGQRIAIVSDLHYPFHDARTWAAVERFLDNFEPDITVWNGDIADFYSISMFDKNPQRAFTFADEISELGALISPYPARWPGNHYFIMGNHEHRLEWYLKKNPELSGLVDLDSLLHLKDRGFTLMPYGGVLDYLGFAITHGTRYSSIPNGTARMHKDMIGGSGVVGHSHRMGQWTYTDMRGTHTFYESGCLCRLDPDYIRQRPPNWQQGFFAGIAHSGAVHLHHMAIYDDGFFGAFTGKFYSRK